MNRPDKMTPEEILQEAAKVRVGLESQAEYLNELYSQLSVHARRSPINDLTYTYISVSTLGKRLAGVVYQAVKRASSTETRVVSAAYREVSVQRKLKEDEAKRKKKAEEEQKIALEESQKKEKTKETQVKSPSDVLERMFGVPFNPSEPIEIDSITSAYEDSSLSDLDEVYGEELT